MWRNNVPQSPQCRKLDFQDQIIDKVTPPKGYEEESVLCLSPSFRWFPGNLWYGQACMFSCIRLFVTPQTVACQAPLPMEFSRQEYWSRGEKGYWSGWPFPTPGDLPDPGVEPTPPASPAWTGRFFTTMLSGKPFGIPWLIDAWPKSLPLDSHDVVPMYVSVSKIPLSYKNTSQIWSHL